MALDVFKHIAQNNGDFTKQEVMGEIRHKTNVWGI